MLRICVLVFILFAFTTKQCLSQETAPKEEVIIESHWDTEGSKGDMIITAGDEQIRTTVEVSRKNEGTTKIEAIISLKAIMQNIINALQNMESKTQTKKEDR